MEIEEIRERFQDWKETRAGSFVWTVLRPFVACLCLVGYVWGPLSLIWWILWFILMVPDWIPFWSKIWWVLGKFLGFGRFKSGQLLKVAQKNGRPIECEIYSLECSSTFECQWVEAQKCLTFPKMERPLKKGRRLLTTNDILLVLEDEQISFDSFSPAEQIYWDPYLSNTRLKVLFDNHIYWANPKHLRRAK